jgi:serine/threonine protein kinase
VALSGFTKLKASVDWTEDWERGGTLGEGEQGIVKLARNSTMEGKLAVKTPQQNEIQCLEREYRIHERLNHSLIVGFEKYLPRTRDRPPEIVSEFVPNGSLADHLPSAKSQN